MATISLRRTKEKTEIGLPPKTIHTCNVELSVDERKLYDEMESEAKSFVEKYIANGSVTHNYSTVLSIILRLRQICTHTELCPEDVRASLSSYNFEGTNITLCEALCHDVHMFSSLQVIHSIFLLLHRCIQQPRTFKEVGYTTTRQ